MNAETLVITGGAGFVGSNLAVLFKQTYPDARVVAVDNLKRRGSELNLSRLRQRGVHFIHGDIRNKEDLNFDFKVDILIECSAEPSVLAGYNEDPAYLINTNLIGTINCLELVRRCNAKLIFLSTSRVYPYAAINDIEYNKNGTRFVWKKDQNVAGWSPGGIGEEFPIDGSRTLYGATKLCSEVFIKEYVAMYGIRALINRCGVLTGPWQFGKVDQGVFALWMLAHYFKRELSYIGFDGSGEQVRDLLHVQDLFELVKKQIDTMDDFSGQVFNVGGGNDGSLSLKECTRLCQTITGHKIPIKADPNPRPGDISIYISDISRVCNAFDWYPQKHPSDTMQDIYNWIQANESDLRSL
jgi:CDP-paratose 2-epimerase